MRIPSKERPYEISSYGPASLIAVIDEGEVVGCLLGLSPLLRPFADDHALLPQLGAGLRLWRSFRTPDSSIFRRALIRYLSMTSKRRDNWSAWPPLFTMRGRGIKSTGYRLQMRSHMS